MFIILLIIKLMSLNKARPIRNQTICPDVVSTTPAASTASADPPIIQPDYVVQGM